MPSGPRLSCDQSTGFRTPYAKNSGHIKALQQLLGFDASKFHSLVIFTGNARFKSPMPINVTRLGGLCPFMQIRTKLLIDYDEASRIAELIRETLSPLNLAPGFSAEVRF